MSKTEELHDAIDSLIKEVNRFNSHHLEKVATGLRKIKNQSILEDFYHELKKLNEEFRETADKELEALQFIIFKEQQGVIK